MVDTNNKLCKLRDTFGSVKAKGEKCIYREKDVFSLVSSTNTRASKVA